MSSEHIVIDANNNNVKYLRELYKFRELLLFLSLRDFLVRYKQTIFGVLWALLRPFIIMVVFTIVFGKFAKLPTEGQIPYALLVFAGLLPWQLFMAIVQQSSDSLLTITRWYQKFISHA